MPIVMSACQATSGGGVKLLIMYWPACRLRGVDRYCSGEIPCMRAIGHSEDQFQ
jgi:hypothetical protein